MTSFYLTLPSDSSKNFYPDNSASHYFTKLPKPITLHGDYEVGLSEIQFVNSYFNVDELRLAFTEISDGERTNNPEGVAEKTFDTIFPAGWYGSNEHLIETLNKTLHQKHRRGKVDPIRFFYHRPTKIVKLRIHQSVKSVRISKNMQDILGFSQDNFYHPGYYHAMDVMEVHGKFRNVYVYSDIVAPRIVGDTYVPLLRALPVGKQNDDVIHMIYDKPQYMPVQRNHFSSLEVLLATSTGAPIIFQSGHTLITLHIRLRKPDY